MRGNFPQPGLTSVPNHRLNRPLSRNRTGAETSALRDPPCPSAGTEVVDGRGKCTPATHAARQNEPLRRAAEVLWAETGAKEKP